MLYTGNLKKITNNEIEKYDEIWLIVRSLRYMPNNPKGNIKHVPELSPSFSLFIEYNNLRNQGKWNKQMFEEQYKPRFLAEMTNRIPKSMLQELAQKSKSKDILIACFCDDESMCHRSLVKQLVENINNKK